MALGSKRYQLKLSRWVKNWKTQKLRAHWYIEDLQEGGFLWGGYTEWQARRTLKKILQDDEELAEKGKIPQS